MTYVWAFLQQLLFHQGALSVHKLQLSTLHTKCVTPQDGVEINLFSCNFPLWRCNRKVTRVRFVYRKKQSRKEIVTSLIKVFASLALRTLSELFDWLKKSIKSHWLKSWQFDSWKLNLKACTVCSLDPISNRENRQLFQKIFFPDMRCYSFSWK